MAIVVVTSNRGLAGAFNSNIGKRVLELLDEYEMERKQGKVEILFIGKKGYDFLKRRVDGCTLNRDYIDVTMDLSYENISGMADTLMDAFTLEQYDMVHVVYAQFKNAAVQIPVSIQFLPVPKLEIVKSDKKKMRADYIFEPNKDELLESLIPSILQTTFHKCVLDTNASEHGARMTAMDKATENANELLKDLKISYNKARQETITNEILEIVGGAAALEG